MKICFLTSILVAGFSLGSAGDWGMGRIFNGKDLEGWDGREGAWEVRVPTATGQGTDVLYDKDGVLGEIWCTGEAKEKNWLIWREKLPEDFELSLQFKWQSGNSGVQVRSDDLGDHQVFGYQAEIARQEVIGLWHHSLLPKDHPRKEERHLMATAGQTVTIAEDGSKTVEQVEDAEKVKSYYKEDDWNKLKIIAKGNKIVQKINGVVFSTVIDNDAKMSRKKGVIALQDHGKGCIVGFRSISFKEL